MQFFDLSGANGRRFSPFGWRVRMALAHVGLEQKADVELVTFSQKHKLDFSGQNLVPVIKDRDQVIFDSWRIASYIDATYGTENSLFGGTDGKSTSRFIASWVDSQIHPLIAQCVVRDILDVIDPADREYFRASREKRFGMPLEQIVENRDDTKANLKRTLYPLRKALEVAPFIGGTLATFSDYAVFGALMWARVTSSFELLESDDPICTWRERMLDLFDSLGRTELSPHA
ncbi:MAG: beta-aryl ether-cleaving protein [Rhodospirillaceae bacterium]|nr:beta-aryl ether-cleaving protein [Rhodospirillaceae bacterium]|tara:strand:- start:213 stop:905 length:693 start_codon:yes stop_codon:yes gene_type:complete